VSARLSAAPTSNLFFVEGRRPETREEIHRNFFEIVRVTNLRNEKTQQVSSYCKDPIVFSDLEIAFQNSNAF
jgi:hypothetical protein